MRLASPVAVVVVLLLLVSACGGGSSRLSEKSYRAHLANVAKESNAAQRNVAKGFHATSATQLAKVLRTFGATETRIGNEVAALKPPKNAEAANRQLAAGLRDTGSEAKAFASKVEKMPSVNAALALLTKTPQTKGGRELDAALAKLKKLGYIRKVS